jgi:hypothetical protein
MQTSERPPTDHTRTYTQTEAAKACGITQRALVDRKGKTGYLTKLHKCFPGRHFPTVAIGSIKNQSEIRLTAKGVEELKDLIQHVSPEPPELDTERNPTYDPSGKVIKRKCSPFYTLNQYSQFIWFKEGIDGAAELARLEQISSTPDAETIDAAFVEAESAYSGAIVSIDHTVEPIETAFELLEQIDSSFWQELERRAEVGYKQGTLLKSVELKARAKAESDREKQYQEQAKNVASRRGFS